MISERAPLGKEGQRKHRPDRCKNGVGCSLWKDNQSVRIDGEGKAKRPYVMFLGEAPGAQEDQQGKPFVGPSGKLIRRLIQEMGLEDDCFITNAVRCRPPENRNPSAQEMRVCGAYLTEEIKRVKPQHIVALGAYAIRALTGEDRVAVSAKRGIRSWEFMGIPVIATYHPAAILRNKKLLPALCEDLNRLASREYVRPEKVQWKFHKTVTPKLLYSSMAFDVETSRLSPYKPGGRILCVSWCGKDHVARVSTDIAGFVSALDQRKPRLVGHNVKFDLTWLREKHGYVHAGPVDDSMVAAHVADENQSLNLKWLASHYTGYGDYAQDVMKFRNNEKLEELPEEQLYEYCCYDSAACWMLLDYMLQQVKDQGLTTLYEQQMRILAGLVTIQSRGFQLDLSKRGAMEIEMTTALRRVEKRIHKKVGSDVLISSNKQLALALYEGLGYVCKKRTRTGGLSVDKEALELIEDDVPAGLSKRQSLGLITDIIEHRAMSKLLGTYLKGVEKSLDSNDRVHPSFNVTGTVTGRLSSSDPNQQNIPREKTAPIKLIYVAPSKRALVHGDYSQIELRIMAWESRDAAMLDCYTSGRDLHTETARAILRRSDITEEERSHAKTANFMTLYGGGAARLARITKRTEAWAERFLRDWQATFPGILDWKRDIRTQLLDQGWVANAFGRRRRLPIFFAGGTRMYDKMLRQACNHPIQGTAGEICNMAMVLVDDKLRELVPGAWVYGAVHDSVLVECRWTDRKRVGNIMRRVMEDTNSVIQAFGHDIHIDVPTPVDVTVGRCWAEMEELT